MINKKLVIIGGDAAGMSAASKIRREQPEREIVVFERGNHTSYAACGIPYYIGGQIKSSENLIARKPEIFIGKNNIDVRIQQEVTEIDIENKKVKVKNNNEYYWESWDELLIATGASPIVPPLQGIDAKGIFSLSTLQSGIDVFNYIGNFHPKKAVVIGGGYIGIELVEALHNLSMDVTLIDKAPQLMSTLDKDMADLIFNYLKKQGVKVFLEEELSKFEKDNDDKLKAVITDKQSIDADIAILGMGVKPNSELAKKAGIEIGESKAIQVNKNLETSIPNIWAAGDCAESFHLITHKYVNIALGTVASKHGLVAGINIAGGNEQFPGVLGTAITKFNSMEIARTGLSEREAKYLGIEFISQKISSTNRASYYPGAEKITVKLLADKNNNRIIGGQIVGGNGSAKRIDIVVTAIAAEFTAQQLVNLDLAYAPPFSRVWDPIQIAARRFI